MHSPAPRNLTHGSTARVIILASGLVTLLAVQAMAARKGEVEIRVVDSMTQQPVAVRMHLKDSRGRFIQPPGVPFWKDHFVFPGKIILSLAPGNYTFEMERGPEYRIRTGYFII